MGSPTKRTDAARSTILKALKLGATLKLAAESAGMHYDTLREWMNNDAAFSVAVRKAEATRAQAALRSIEKAAKEDNWQAAAWYLERRYPTEYGRTIQQQQVSGEVNHTVRITYVNDWRAATFQAAESEADANVVEAIAAPAVTAASGGVEEERDGSR
jgi:hypothetical protein